MNKLRNRNHDAGAARAYRLRSTWRERQIAGIRANSIASEPAPVRDVRDQWPPAAVRAATEVGRVYRSQPGGHDRVQAAIGAEALP